MAKFGADEIEKSAIEGRAATSKGRHIYSNTSSTFQKCPQIAWMRANKLTFPSFNLNIGRFAVFELSRLILEVINDWSVEHVLRQRVTL